MQLRPDKDWILKIDALIRYYFHEDTNKLSDEEFAIRYRQLNWVLKSIGRLKDE